MNFCYSSFLILIIISVLYILEGHWFPSFFTVTCLPSLSKVDYYKLGRVFSFFFFVMVVANCNASCDWLYVRCSQWELLLFFHLDSSLHLSQYGRFHAVSFETASRDAQTLNLLRNVSKFNAQQVVSLMNEQQSQKLLFKVEPLSPTKTTS